MARRARELAYGIRVEVAAGPNRVRLGDVLHDGRHDLHEHRPHRGVGVVALGHGHGHVLLVPVVGGALVRCLPGKGCAVAIPSVRTLDAVDEVPRPATR